MQVGPANLPTASAAPLLHLTGDYYHAGNPGLKPLDCGQAGHDGLCHSCEQQPPCYFASDLETALLLAPSDVSTDEEPILVLRWIHHVEVEMPALDLISPSALTAYGIPSFEQFEEDDLEWIRRHAESARRRKGIAGVLCPCPKHIPSPAPDALLLAVFPNYLKSPYVEIIEDYYVRTEFSYYPEFEIVR